MSGKAFMSISLHVHLADGGSEELTIGPQDAARACGRIGKELGLKWLDEDYPIILRTSNILNVIEEFKTVLRESEARVGWRDERMHAAVARMAGATWARVPAAVGRRLLKDALTFCSLSKLRLSNPHPPAIDAKVILGEQANRLRIGDLLFFEHTMG